MKANVGKLVELLKGETKRFIIPLYQREYSWEMKECDTLLQDLQESIQNNFANHFFGSIVFHSKSDGKLTNYYLIDGQQRISTIFILLLAIKKVCYERKYTKIDTKSIDKDFLFDGNNIKLKMAKKDEESLKKICDNKFNKSETNLIRNYYFFYSKLCEINEGKVRDIFNAITKLEIVFISLDIEDGDKPQAIFESLNSKGVKLSESDKIRNYVLMNNDSKKLDDIYLKCWEPVENSVGKENLDKFFRHYLAKRTYELPNSEKLYLKFKEFRESNIEYADIEKLMADVRVYADYYEEIMNCKRTDKGYKGTIARLTYLKVNTSIPLIFDFFDAKRMGNLNEPELNESLDILEAYFTRRTFCTEEISSLNKTFVSMGKDIHSIMLEKNISYIDAYKYTVISRSGKTRFPKDTEFDEHFPMFELYNSKPEFRKYIFERLENYGYKAPDKVIEYIDDHTYTIEHIMPQTLTNEWRKYLGHDWEKIHSKYLHTIGNLTITEYNSEYSNLIFEKKKTLPKKGFAESKIHINRDISNCSKWNEEAINHHANEMLILAKEIWKYPSCNFDIDVDYVIQTLQDDISFENFEIKSFRFKGDEFECANFNDVFKKLCHQLYFHNEKKFSNFKSKFQSNRNKFKSSFKVGESLYVDLSMNVFEKIEYVRGLASYLKIELDDIEFILKKKEKFNIYKDSSYVNAKAGEFAKESFKYLFKHNLLKESDIQMLLDIKTSKQIFPRSVYPTLSIDRMSSATVSVKNEKSTITYRYYDEPIEYNGEVYYLSSQWYPYTKEGLIKYFKEKRDF